jgi:hypothetical protein
MLTNARILMPRKRKGCLPAKMAKRTQILSYFVFVKMTAELLQKVWKFQKGHPSPTKNHNETGVFWCLYLCEVLFEFY